MPKKQVYLNEASLAEHIHTELIASGYAPTGDETWDIAEIVFDYLVSLGMECDE